MPKTRRDLLIAMRQKLQEAVSTDPELLKKLKRRFDGNDKAALDVIGAWLDAPVSDEEFERKLIAAQVSPKLIRSLLDPRFFPSRTSASIDGSN
jgi:hypothetical protein